MAPSVGADPVRGAVPTLRAVESAESNADELEREIERLRTELDRCEGAVRAVEAEKGELRGQLAEMSVQLGRARQAQEWAETGGPTVAERVRLRWDRTRLGWDDGRRAARRTAGAIRRRLRGAGPPR